MIDCSCILISVVFSNFVSVYFVCVLEIYQRFVWWTLNYYLLTYLLDYDDTGIHKRQTTYSFAIVKPTKRRWHDQWCKKTADGRHRHIVRWAVKHDEIVCLVRCHGNGRIWNLEIYSGFACFGNGARGAGNSIRYSVDSFHASDSTTSYSLLCPLKTFYNLLQSNAIRSVDVIF